MKSLFLSSVAAAVAALSSMGTSAELLNQWLLDQMNASSTQTRTQVKAEISRPQQEAIVQPGPGSADVQKESSTDKVNADAVLGVRPEQVQAQKP